MIVALENLAKKSTFLYYLSLYKNLDLQISTSVIKTTNLYCRQLESMGAVFY